jgi:hypothetical protein
MMRMILILFWIIQIGGAWQLLHVPPALSSSIPHPLQLLAVLGWIVLFTWGIISDPANKSRAISLICGFIVYSLLRLILFAVTDYDHQRRFFLILTALVVGGMMMITLFNPSRPPETTK